MFVSFTVALIIEPLNPETVIDKGTFVDPNQYPEGIDAVMVNGSFALIGGLETYACNGAVLRKPR